MLQEVAAFEEQLQAQTQMAEASQALGTAAAKIEALREAELAAQAACEALLARRDQLQGLQTETDAELLAAKTRLSDAQQAAAELEKRLREALQHTHDAAALIERVEAESGELASSQAAVEEEISLAMERVQACRQETAAAQTEAEAAREHVKALNGALASPSGDDPFTALQRLALRLAEDASTMAAAAEKKKGPQAFDLSEGATPELRARRAFPDHPVAQVAYLAGWRSCADYATTNNSVHQILVQYVRRLYGLTDYQPNKVAMEAMRDALDAFRDKGSL
jgi:DNA repair exonuclease SbcCD ATPase subunit